MHRVLCLLLALLVIGSPPANAQGTIRYVNPPDVWFISGDEATLPIDIDSNQTDDYLLHIRYGSEFMLVGLAHNSALSNPAIPPDLGSDLLPLAGGSTIPVMAPSPFAWVTSYIHSTDPISGPYYIAPILHTRTTIGTGGLWNDLEGYAGLQFEIDGQMHFGWLRIDVDSFRTGGTLKDWAYNTVPGQPIFAGQVPEPSTWAMILGGLALLALRHHRRDL